MTGSLGHVIDTRIPSPGNTKRNLGAGRERFSRRFLTMLRVILISFGLVALNVVIHTGGLAVMLRALMKSHAALPVRPLPITWLLIRTTWWLILIHLAEIAVWALFYMERGAMPDAESAFYFSGVTYTTVGYGDMVLPKPWRILAPLEALTGVLMCGLSTGFFFAVVTRIYVFQKKAETK